MGNLPSLSLEQVPGYWFRYNRVADAWRLWCCHHANPLLSPHHWEEYHRTAQGWCCYSSEQLEPLTPLMSELLDEILQFLQTEYPLPLTIPQNVS